MTLQVEADTNDRIQAGLGPFSQWLRKALVRDDTPRSAVSPDMVWDAWDAYEGARPGDNPIQGVLREHVSGLIRRRIKERTRSVRVNGRVGKGW